MNKNLNSPNLDAMVKIVSQKLNVSPETLTKQLKEGKFDSALNSMNSSERDKFNRLMNYPEMAKKLLSTPQLQALYKKLTQ